MKAIELKVNLSLTPTEADMVHAMLVKNAEIIQSAISKIRKSMQEEISDVKSVPAGQSTPATNAN